MKLQTGFSTKHNRVASTSIAFTLALASPFSYFAAAPVASAEPSHKHTLPAVPTPAAKVSSSELAKLGMEYVTTRKMGGTSQVMSEYRLKNNGLSILISERHATPIATVMVVYHVGSRNEAVGYTGSTHFLEHMMFKGTTRLDPLKGTGIDDTLKPIGGYNNATTSYDRTNYYEIVPSKDINMCLDLEADRMRHLLLRKDDHDAEMTVVRNELERGEDEPAEILEQNLFSTAFKEHPYHHPIIGWRSDVENVPLKRLRQFYDEFYWPNNATLVVVGDFTTLPVLKSIAGYFGKIPRSPKPFPNVYTKEPAQEGERRFTVQRGSELPRVAIAYHGVDVRNKDNYALDVLDAIMGDESKKSSRLYKALVDTGLASETDANNTSLRDPGLYVVGATVTPQTAPEVLEKALLAQVEAVKKERVSEAELDRAKKSVLKRVRLSASDPMGMADQIAESVAGADWEWLAKYPERINAVTTADIQHVAQKYFLPSNMTVGYYIPKSKPADAKGGTEKAEAKAADHAPPPTVPQAAEQQQKEGANGDKPGAADRAAKQVPPIASDSSSPVVPIDRDRPVAGAPTGNPGASVSQANKEPVRPEPAAATQPTTYKLVSGKETGRFSTKVHKYVFANGLTLLVMPIEGTGTVALSGRLKAGGYFKDPQKTLVPDLMAEQLTAGSKSMTKEQLAQTLETLGTTLNFSDDDFWLSFNSEVTSEDLSTFLPLVADSLQQPLFLDAELNKSKKVKLASLKDQMADTGNVSLNHFSEAWYKPDSVYYNRPFEEQISELDTITTGDLRKFHDEHVTPANTVLTVVGDIAPDKAVALVQNSFGSWNGDRKERIDVNKTVLVPKPEQQSIRTELPDKANVDVIMGKPVDLTARSADYFPTLIGNSALGYDSFACRLAPVRDKYGLTYSISSSFSGEFPFAPWMIAYSVNPTNYGRALDLVRKIVGDYLKTGITTAELAKEKSHLEGAFYVGMRGPRQIASKLCELEILGLGAPFMDNYGDNLRKVTLPQVNACVRKYFTLKDVVTSSCGTFAKSEKVPGKDRPSPVR